MDQSVYIEINPEKRFGKPIIKGTRISVDDVLNWIDEGMSFDDIINDYPELNKEQIKVCLIYASNK
jgi:uncharacterized protein (DUF433 family)